MKKLTLVMVVLILGCALVWAAGGRDAGGRAITLELVQWWQPEMRAGSFERIIADFEARNPGVTVKPINLPFAQMLDQIVIGNASNTLSDVLGMNPPWLYDFIQQGIVEPLDEHIARTRFDTDSLSAQLIINNRHWIFPVAVFFNPMFYNIDHFFAVVM